MHPEAGSPGTGTAAELDEQTPASAYELTTSDDTRALELAQRAQASPRGGLVLTARRGLLDPFVLALGDARIAVRHLELRVSPLESMFFALTAEQTQIEELEPNEFADRVLAGT